jgi:transposase
MAKYPGAFILNEYGTNKELASIYNVSERTIYRWKAKATAETGARAKKPTRPRASTLQNFKGTRKQLAKKYGVSERTAYRWLAQAKANGVDIKSRKTANKYPGEQILLEYGTNKELADVYGVSERTIARWKRKARIETQNEPAPITEEIAPVQPQDDDFFNELFGTDEPAPEEPEEMPDISDRSESFKSQLDDISTMLSEYDLLADGSIFSDLNPELKRIYLNAYIQYQWDINPYMFNQSPPDDPNGPDISDPDKIANIDIWGDEFETWLTEQIDIDNI